MTFLMLWRHAYANSKLEKKLSRLAKQGHTGSPDSEATQTPSPHIHAGKLETLRQRNQESGLVLSIRKETANSNTQTKL